MFTSYDLSGRMFLVFCYLFFLVSFHQECPYYCLLSISEWSACQPVCLPSLHREGCGFTAMIWLCWLKAGRPLGLWLHHPSDLCAWASVCYRDCLKPGWTEVSRADILARRHLPFSSSLISQDWSCLCTWLGIVRSTVSGQVRNGFLLCCAKPEVVYLPD